MFAKKVKNKSVYEAHSFGYWGWGHHAKKLVRLVDYVEAVAGRKPPIFVDIRIRRQVRAINFSGRNFEKIVGKNRYLYMPELGNRAIVDKKL